MLEGVCDRVDGYEDDQSPDIMMWDETEEVCYYEGKMLYRHHTVK